MCAGEWKVQEITGPFLVPAGSPWPGHVPSGLVCQAAELGQRLLHCDFLLLEDLSSGQRCPWPGRPSGKKEMTPANPRQKGALFQGLHSDPESPESSGTCTSASGWGGGPEASSTGSRGCGLLVLEEPGEEQPSGGDHRE